MMAHFDQRGQQVTTQINTENVSVTILGEDDELWVSLLTLDEFVVSQTEEERVQHIFVHPKGYNLALETLSQRKMLWIVGPSGIGKRTLGLSLAFSLKHLNQTVLSIKRFVNWSQLDKTELQNSTIILPDALGAVRFEREKLENELKYLENLLTRNNIVIVTCPDDVFSDAGKEVPRFSEWVSKVSRKFSLNTEAYDYQAKVGIFEKTIRYAHDITGEINDEQQERALELLKVHG